MTEVLVAGVGNIFAGDDAFGSEVARRMLGRPLPPGMRVVDFGIRAIDLAYALQDGCDAAVLVDAAPRGGAPGTLYVIDPQHEAAPAPAAPLGHGFDATTLLRGLAAGRGRCRRVLVVGCEPQTLGDAEFGALGLSAAVARAVEEAIPVVERLAAQLAAGEGGRPPQPRSTAR